MSTIWSLVRGSFSSAVNRFIIEGKSNPSSVVPVLDSVDLVLKVVRERDMGQHLPDTTSLWGRPERVSLRRKILSNHHGILADDAKAVGHLFGGVVVHKASSMVHLQIPHPSAWDSLAF